MMQQRKRNISRLRSWWQNTRKTLDAVIVTSLVALLRIMVSRLRSWWQQIKQHRVAIGVVAIVLVVVIALIIAGYWFDWTGFNGYTQVTIAHTTSGPSAGTVVRTEVYQPGKALWDWMQLLIIPVVLVVGGFLLNYTTNRNEQKANEQRAKIEREAAERYAKTERDLALDNQREQALQAYIDNMSALLLEKKLRESAEDDEVQKIARVRTLTVLLRLDGRRKGSVLQFLYESDLVKKDNKVIDLEGADFSGADLSGANLPEADLIGANLRGASLLAANLSIANLSGALLDKADLSYATMTKADLTHAEPVEADLRKTNLSDAVLIGAYLTGANLRDANLSRANLREAEVTTEQLDKAKSLEGAIMPDGTKHA